MTNMGDLFGQRFLRRIKELDERLTVHDGNLRVMGLPVKTDATHKRLVKCLRDFTANGGSDPESQSSRSLTRMGRS